MFLFDFFASLDYRNLSILAGLLLCLWTGLGLIFWGKINIALSIRQRNYFALDEDWNGDFEINRFELETPIIGGLFIPPLSTGYPDIPCGCEASKDDDRLLELDVDGVVECKDEHWAVFPWQTQGFEGVKDTLTACDGLEKKKSKYSPTCALEPATCDAAKVCMFAVPKGTLAAPATAGN